MNIVEEIFERADRNAAAIFAGEEMVRFGELAALTEELAGQIRKSGVMGRGGVTRIGLSCPNGVAHVVLALAILRAGGCLAPIAGELPAFERDKVARETDLAAVAAGEGGEWPLAHGRAVELKCARFRAVLWLELGEAGKARGSLDEGLFAALNPALVRFSSGTTGKSKGVVLSHETLRARVEAANQGLNIGPGDRVVWILPMAHHFAVSILLYLRQGAATILAGSHLAEDVLTVGRRHGGTVLYAAPFHHQLLAGEKSGRGWETLRLAVSTAAPLPLSTAGAFAARFGLPLSQGLGIIELGLPILNTRAAREKPGSIGRVQAGFEAELRDERGRAAAEGQSGELFLKGPGMLDAYLSPWRLRAEILEDGWFRTGDIARMDAEGDLFLEGRTHSVINVAGMKCFPEEIESVLCEHPEVKAARVSGKPHPMLGAAPFAEIVPRDLERAPAISSLVRHCRAALAPYKIPVQFTFQESLPQTPNGKVRR